MPGRLSAAAEQRRRSKLQDERKVLPVTNEERLRWKQQEVNKFLHLAEAQPHDRALYLAAARRAQGEADDIERLVLRDQQVNSH